jgi:N-acetyl-anhydromuramyl-L-alanine amidase AmpD
VTQSKEFPQYVWVTPKSYTKGRKPHQPTVIFIHTTEGSEGPSSAENGAAYDARRTDGTSTHFFTDSNSVIQCVLTTDESHATRSHGNDVGISIEVCGKAGQSAAQWADAASAATIEQTARLCVNLRKKYGKSYFPLVNLTPAQLRAGQHGFAEHKDATLAWPEDGGTHTDPGPNFPWSKLFARITQLETPPAKPPTEELPVNSTDFNKLMDGWASSTNGKKLLGEAVLAAAGWSSGYSGRKLGQHADDDQTMRNFLFGKPDKDGQQIPADSPVAKMAKAAQMIIDGTGTVSSS